MRAIRSVHLAVLLIVGFCGAGWAQVPTECGSLKNAYGPFDYRKHKAELEVVEGFHFNSRVERLVSGMTGVIGHDIDYTLRASPNHHRALVAMMRLFEREKPNRPGGVSYSIYCYFERAVRFASDDTVARGLFATFLIKADRLEEAAKQVDFAVAVAGDNPFTHYNAGLLYFELKQYERALVQAHKATALGFPRTELTESLKRVGAWKEPSEADDAILEPQSNTPTAVRQ